MKTKIVVLLIILFIPILAYPKNEADRKILALEKKLGNLRGKEKIPVLIDLASVTYTKSPKKCVDYCKRVLTLTEQIEDPIRRAKAFIYLSYALSVLGDWDKALAYSKEALTIYEEQKDKGGIGRALFTIGYLYREIDYFNIALDYLLRSLKAYEGLGEERALYFPYYNLGCLYFSLENYQKASEYLRKASDTVKDKKDNRQISTCLHNLGLCYLQTGDYIHALDYFRRALRMFEDSGNTFWTAASLSNIGRVYGLLDNRQQALRHLSKARQLREEIGDKLGLFNTLCFIGDTRMKEKKFPRALSNYGRAFQIITKLDDKNNLNKLYERYADCYAAMGKYKSAFEYHKKYSDIREHLFNQKKNKQLAELEVQFEAEKKEKEIEILKKNNKIQVITRNGFITGFALVSIILILLFKKYLYLFAFWKRQRYIGQYRLIECIGTGGMGTVYLAHTVRDKKRLSAVKVLKDELVEDECSRQRFKQEGTIIDKVRHPNIVRIFERGDYKGKLYIAMEYLQGKTLAQKIKEEGQLELKDCLNIMKQISEALAFIHKKNILHRDLKPANIMLIERVAPAAHDVAKGDSSKKKSSQENKTSTHRSIEKESRGDVVKLLDFGVALMDAQTRLTQSGILVGTINYVAPEQITKNLYSPAGDIYAMGMIFYEMLVGQSAFPRVTLTEVVEKILAEIPEPAINLRPDIPAELNRLVMRLLAKEPAQRPGAENILSHLKKIEHFNGA